MTEAELKQIAKEMGYNVIKKPKYTKLLPCVCGSRYRKTWRYAEGQILCCVNCGLETPMAFDEKQAREFWNEMITEKMKNV